MGCRVVATGVEIGGEERWKGSFLKGHLARSGTFS